MPKLRVLIVDDVQDVCMLMEDCLPGCEVITANDGIEGLEKFITHGPFDVVVTDLEMPRCSGDGMIIDIRKRVPNQPCLMLSGNPTLLARAEANLEVTVMGKPFNVDAFARKVHLLAKNRTPVQ